MKNLAIVFLVAFCFFQGTGLASIPVITEKIFTQVEISGKIDLFGEAGEDDFSEEGRVEGCPVPVNFFFKVIKTGIPKSGMHGVEIFVIRKTLEGKHESDTLSGKEFFITPDGMIVFVIGFTIDDDPCELLVGEFLIRILKR
jgi:hypothetical protein